MVNPSFAEHPRFVGESHREHTRSAWSFSAAMIGGWLACFVHGLFPFLSAATGSSIIRRLHDRMFVNRVRSRAPAGAGPGGGRIA